MRFPVFVLLCLTWSTAFAQVPSNTIALLKRAKGKEKTRLYVQISEAYTYTQPDSAVHYANEGMLLAEQTNDEQGMGLILLQLGRINAVHHHNDLARKFENEALGIFRSIQDAEDVAQAYDELGLLEGEEDETRQAAKSIHTAMRLYEDSRNSDGVIKTYEGLGRIYEARQDTEKAISYYLRALTLYEQHTEKPEAYYILLENIGNLYMKKGDERAALRYLQQGVHDSKIAKRRDTEVNLLDEEGKAYEDEKQQKKALETFKQALADAKKFRKPGAQAQALVDIAGILEQQNAGASLADLKTALGIAQKLRRPQLTASIYAAMAKVYRQEKNYREAMAALEEQRHLLDSALAANRVKDIAALDSSYMLQRSVEKIANLQKIDHMWRNEIDLCVVVLLMVAVIITLLIIHLRKIKRLNRELVNSNRVKDTLFSVIGHDLKGPASSAAQLFGLMETEQFTEAEMKSMIADLRKQTTASLELLQSLFEWGKAQLQGISVNQVTFNPRLVIERSIKLLTAQSAQKHITIADDVKDHLEIYADANHFELIIRNLLSNAIKFSYNGGTINIGASEHVTGREVVFSVRDCGIGISKPQQKLFPARNMKVNFGTGNEKGSGLGLLLVKDYVKANKGRIWLESAEGKGSTFYVALPVA